MKQKIEKRIKEMGWKEEASKSLYTICKTIIYIITFGSVFAFVSCTGTKKVATAIAGDDVEELIIDSYKYPKQSESIKNYLTSKDYMSASYGDLILYREISIYDEQLYDYFSNVIGQKEDSIVSSLSTMGIHEIAEYYKAKEDEHNFLNEILYETFVTNSDDLSYDDVKAMYAAFISTDLEEPLRDKYIARRDLIYPYAEIYGEEYEDSILNLLSGMEIQQVGNYYKSHSYDQKFLKPILQNTYLADINDLEYQDVKGLANAFASTDLAEVFIPKYDSIRTALRPLVEESINAYVTAEQELLTAYKSYAYEETMNYLTNASQEIIATYIMPSLGEYWDAFWDNPTDFLLNVGKGMVDGIVDAAKSAYNFFVGLFSDSDKGKKKGSEETYDKMFYRTYASHISKKKIISTIDKYISEARNELNDARNSFVYEMTGRRNANATNIKKSENKECPTFKLPSNISEMKKIYDRQNEDDVVGDVMEVASWIPVVGDVISLIEIGKSLFDYNSDAKYVKEKLDEFQYKMNEHISQMAEFYTDALFNEMTENTIKSRNNLKRYIYENY